MRNRHDGIKNEIAYFNKIIKNMDIKQSIKDSKIDNHETVCEEIENVFFYEDKYFCNSNLLEWIELIENADLYKALKSLNIKEQVLISYIFNKEKTQSEVAKFYCVAQKT